MGVSAQSARSLSAGASGNRHWLVRTSDGLLILRRYQARRTQSYAEYEVRLLKRLSEKGWPVPLPVTGLLTVEGFVWCAFSHLAGRSRTPRTKEGIKAEQRARGRLLAKLHEDLALCTDLGQREGWMRAEEVLEPRKGELSLHEVLDLLERKRPEEARILRWHADAARERLQELGAQELPSIVIHGDFAPWNIRYRSGSLSGIFDFDLSHLNLRVADFALSWRGLHDEVVHGYADVSPLPENEMQLLRPVLWTWCLAGARDQLLRDEDSNLDWVITHIVRRSPLTTGV